MPLLHADAGSAAEGITAILSGKLAGILEQNAQVMYRAMDRWLPGYLCSLRARVEKVSGTKHVLFCIADHFEPFFGGVGRDHALRRVQRWAKALPNLVEDLRDADGVRPRHTFFCPHDEYDEACLEAVAQLCRDGFGEVELQLHHRNDTKETLREKLEDARDCLHGKHGCLGRDAQGRARYGFVHGNWALCNSRPDGDWCGVNEELGVLCATGCYADFTFPSAPSPTQPRKVNEIYRAVDRLDQPRGHDEGDRVAVGGVGRSRRERRGEDGRLGDPSLPIIQGPLALNWRRRKWGLVPRLENGVISADNPPSAVRADLWVRQHIHVVGRPEWVFAKVVAHGAVDGNAEVLLGESMRRLHEHLQESYNDGTEWQLHYVTAREMYNIVRAAEDDRSGNPREWRDYEIMPP